MSKLESKSSTCDREDAREVESDSFPLAGCKHNDTHSWVTNCYNPAELEYIYFNTLDCRGDSVLTERHKKGECLSEGNGNYLETYWDGACKSGKYYFYKGPCNISLSLCFDLLVDPFSGLRLFQNL